MKDIEGADDIAFLVNEFYKTAINDDEIGVFFTQVVQLNWEKHIPTINAFWSQVILHQGHYQGNPMLVHIGLSKKKKLLPKHFSQWLHIWQQTVQQNFKGKNAQTAIDKAKQIAMLMQLKVSEYG